MTKYSQNDEQTHILNFFGDLQGRFLDIGACDGRWCSNTLALVEKGWSGVLIEPSPYAFAKLKQLHGGNPNLVLVQAAVGVECSIDALYDSPKARGYSTMSVVNRTKWDHLAGFNEVIPVPVLSLRGVLKSYSGAFDFVSIDTEGSSIELFCALLDWYQDYSRVHRPPRMICAEHDGDPNFCVTRSRAMGYIEIARNAENIIFTRH